MSKKNGTRIDLGNFLSDVSSSELPSGPSGRPSVRHQRRDQEDGPPRSDDASWGRGSGDRFEGRGGDRFEGRGGDRFEGRGGDRFEGRGDFDERPPPPPSAADQDDQWRRTAPAPRPQEESRPVSQADQDDRWRRTAPAPRQQEEPRPVSQADQDDRWRRSSPVAPPARVDAADQQDQWRGRSTEQRAVSPDGRPKLNLRKSEKDDAPKEESKPVIKATADKWANIFPSSSSTSTTGRRFGDMDKDKEREKEFQRPHAGASAFGSSRRSADERFDNREDRSRASAAFGGGNRRDIDGGRSEAPFGGRSRDDGSFGGGSRRDAVEAPAAFSGGNRNREDGAFSGRREAPSAFSGGNRNREEGYEAPSAFSGGSRNREDGQFGGRRETPSAFGGGNRNREEGYEAPSAFSGGSRNREDGQFGGRRETPSAFGGGNRNRDEGYEAPSAFGGRNPSAFGKNERSIESSEYMGGMERLKMSEPAAKKPPVKKEEVVKHVLSEEELISIADALINSYLVVENKKEAAISAKKLTPEYLPKLVQKCVVKVYSEGIKESKLVVSLWSYFVQEGILDLETIMAGLELICNKVDEDKTLVVRRIGSLFQENGLDLSTLDALSPIVQKVAFPDVKSKDEAIAETASLKSIVDKALASPGQSLQVLKDQTDKRVAVLLVKTLLEKTPEVVKDETCSWCDKSQFGKVLAHFLYQEEPSSDMIKLQLEVLHAVQEAFDQCEFPRAADNQSLIEKTFMKLYNEDIIALETIIEWKDDITDTRGKLTAIVQLSQFVNWLEQDDDEGEDDEEEDSE